MASQKKISANRSNAKKSTGPKSATGKGRSRFNAVKSGIYAVHRPLPSEDHEAYLRLSRRLKKRYQPTDPIEELLVDQILGHIWRVGRLESAEKAYLNAIDETRCKRQGQFDFELNALVAREENHALDTSNITLLANARFTSRSIQCEPEIIDDLSQTLLEASVSRAEEKPLVDLRAQRSAILAKILWLEEKIESKRMVSFNHFVARNSLPPRVRCSKKLKRNRI